MSTAKRVKEHLTREREREREREEGGKETRKTRTYINCITESHYFLAVGRVSNIYHPECRIGGTVGNLLTCGHCGHTPHL